MKVDLVEGGDDVLQVLIPKIVQDSVGSHDYDVVRL